MSEQKQNYLGAAALVGGFVLGSTGKHGDAPLGAFLIFCGTLLGDDGVRSRWWEIVGSRASVGAGVGCIGRSLAKRTMD